MPRQACIGLLLATLILPPALAAQEARASVSDVGEADARETRWQGPDGPLPFASEDQLRDFLRRAPIVSQKELTGGINRPLKVRLEQDGVAANAIFRIVDVRKKRARLDGKLVADFHDSYVYECAAYEVSRLLGIDNVPTCAPRRFQMINGSMQLWVESATTEKQRRDAGKEPPVLLHWLRQKQTMRLFDALIYNFDRNLGNMLIDDDWKLWYIDHTRSFRSSTAVERIENIIWVERRVWERLQALDKKQLSRPLKPYVSTRRIGQLLKRRDKLVAHLQARIDEKGEGGVIFDSYDFDLEISPAGFMEMLHDDDIPETSSKLGDPEAR